MSTGLPRENVIPLFIITERISILSQLRLLTEMDCIFPNCKETQYDPFLQCWVWVDLAHPKCASFSDRKVDHVCTQFLYICGDSSDAGLNIPHGNGACDFTAISSKMCQAHDTHGCWHNEAFPVS
uniref:Uncharacterized protein n=1 Tax=Glossina pallidipes TaxID=7398 RepID=A0A1B0AEF1_GLOPL